MRVRKLLIILITMAMIGLSACTGSSSTNPYGLSNDSPYVLDSERAGVGERSYLYFYNYLIYQDYWEGLTNTERNDLAGEIVLDGIARGVERGVETMDIRVNGILANDSRTHVFEVDLNLGESIFITVLDPPYTSDDFRRTHVNLE